MGYTEDRGPNPFEDVDEPGAEADQVGLEGLLDLLDLLLEQKPE